MMEIAAMCFVQSQDPEPIQKPSQITDPNVTGARDASNRANRAAAGSQSTILSTLMRNMSGFGQQKTLMGQ